MDDRAVVANSNARWPGRQGSEVGLSARLQAGAAMVDNWKARPGPEGESSVQSPPVIAAFGIMDSNRHSF